MPQLPAAAIQYHRSNALRRSLVQFSLRFLAPLVAVALLGCAPQRGTVGARFGRDDDGHLYVRDAPEGLGAAAAGLRPGDEVILIEGRDVRALSEEQLHVILSGERGSPVRFTVLRGDAVLRMTVARTPPPLPRPAPNR